MLLVCYSRTYATRSHFNGRPICPRGFFPNWSSSVDQPVPADLPDLSIENRNLLPPRMKITPYNLHEGFS